MTLAVYDTLTREKRVFTPRDTKRVTLYVCGPTVYSFAHIGNARPVVVFDLLFRLLRHTYGADHVIYARNITDVDDKINAAASAQGVDISVITEKFARIYNEDMAALGALPPSLQPKATAHIGQMIDVIAKLIDNGHAYAAEGHVLFATSTLAQYGALSGRSLDDMIAGARVEVAPYKREPADFVLWKPSKPGEPVWDSPWGPGRPGWHIECTAMIAENLGLPIDIHGGGHDLIFPHHENEMAQGCGAYGIDSYATYWMHNGFLTVEAEKMSKSIGNVLLVHDLVQHAPGEAIRWALLAGHYRAPLDWNGDGLAQAKRNLDRLYGALERVQHVPATDAPIPADVLAALCDDLNTPKAIAELFALAKALETAPDADKPTAKGALLAAAHLMGFLTADPAEWFAGSSDADDRDAIEALVAERSAARANKDWAASDRIRATLTEMGVEVLDGAGGSTWRRI